MLPASWKRITILYFREDQKLLCVFTEVKSEKSGPTQGKRRSPSYARRQERRKLLRKKTDPFPEEPMESRETNNDCSLDLSPNPDSGLFGNREESEEESIAAESENDSEKEDGSDASSRDPVEPEEGDNWTPVTPRVRRQGGPRVSIVNSYNRHRIVEEKSTGGGPSGKDICWVTHCVYAPADAARADIERAMLNKDITKIKLISGPTYNPRYEFSSDGRFHLSGNEISHVRKSGHNRLIQLARIIICFFVSKYI